jgi:hypothetical protein
MATESRHCRSSEAARPQNVKGGISEAGRSSANALATRIACRDRTLGRSLDVEDRRLKLHHQVSQPSRIGDSFVPSHSTTDELM